MINGVTPLFIAAQKGHTEVVAALLDGGANANQGKHPLLFLSDLFHCAGSRPPMPPQWPAPAVSSLSLPPCPFPPRALTLAHSHRSWGDWAQTEA